jgi:hypothetical protein
MRRVAEWFVPDVSRRLVDVIFEMSIEVTPCPEEGSIVEDLSKALLLVFELGVYRYAPHNDVSVNGRPHIRRWSHNIIL